MVRSANTERAYRGDWRAFRAWCAARDRTPLPAAAADVAAFVDEQSRLLRASTLERRVAAIAWVHREAGAASPAASPEVRLALARARWGQRATPGDAVPLDAHGLRRLVGCLGDGVADRRDRAMVLLTYGAALRPSEVSALDVGDVTAGTAGAVPALRVHLARGVVAVPRGSAPELCALAAWQAWLAASGLRGGAAFRPVERDGRVGDRRLGERAVRAAVKRAVARAGLDPLRYSSTSLRRGMVVTAAAVGVSDERIMAQTGLRSRALVRRYARPARDGRG